MIKVRVVTPSGQLFEEETQIIIARNILGEQAIMKDHLPLVVAIDPGYVRFIRNDETLYITIVGGFLEFSDNEAKIVAQEAEIGRDHENALNHLVKLRSQRTEENRRRSIDFTKAERDLRKSIGEIGGASDL